MDSNEPITSLLLHLTWQLKTWRHKRFTTGRWVAGLIKIFFSSNSFEFTWTIESKTEDFGRNLSWDKWAEFTHPLGFDTNLTLSPTQTYYCFPHTVVGPFQRLRFNRFRPNVSPHQSQGIETIHWSLRGRKDFYVKILETIKISCFKF